MWSEGRGIWSPDGSAELLRQRELRPVAEARCFPRAVALGLHCPLQGSSLPREEVGQMP